MVTGVSAGVGKSTFARELGGKLDIPVYHLDRFYWKPGWIIASSEEFITRQQNIATLDQWIMEGNYSGTYDIRSTRADTIIYLELPLRVCLYRVFKRWVLNIGKTRPDMGEDCKEKLDYPFLKFICTTYKKRKEKMAYRFQVFQQNGSQKDIITLKSKEEIRAYLDSLPH
jgi:adenylate kinase family enzyme